MLYRNDPPVKTDEDTILVPVVNETENSEEGSEEDAGE